MVKENNEELLKYINENNIIDLAYVQEQIEMKKKEEILKKHPYRIWLASDGYWKTYLPNRDGGKSLVKKKKEKDLKECVIEFYTKKVDCVFKARFDDWVNRQRSCGRSDNTISKYYSDYRRFIEGDALEKMDIRKISEIELSEFINRKVKEQEVQWRALKGLFGYFKGIFDKAVRDKIISENPCTYVDLPLFKCKCGNGRQKTSAERTLSDQEKKMLLKKIENSTNIGNRAVELALYTGMRVGELAGLKWEDVDYEQGVITICRSEKYNQITKERYISSTKNDKVRVIPLTEEMKWVLQKVRKFEMKNGWLGEFVFQDENGRVHASRISDCARNNTMSREFKNPKSIHAIRRTLNSNMKCAGVPTTVAASLLGHTEKVNETNYTYDVCSMDEKYRYIENAGRI